jgi:hypothetical protein
LINQRTGRFQSSVRANELLPSNAGEEAQDEKCLLKCLTAEITRRKLEGTGKLLKLGVV